MTLSIEEKNEIRGALQAYVGRFPSQTKAVQSLKKTSGGTVSSILNGKYENISDDMFRNIAVQVGGASKGWQLVETSVYQEITFAMRDAQEQRNVTWIVGAAGCGKTTTASVYCKEHRETFYVLCDEDMKKGDFLRETARAIGLKTDGYRLRTILNMIVDAIVQMDAPLLVFDEADKLNDPVFHYFINLYNRLEDKCGIIFLSTSYIEHRMEMGLRYNKKGYNEIHSRIGRKFYDLEETNANDIYSICAANGLNDKMQIAEVMHDAEKCDFDLRRVKKAIHRVKKMGTK